MKKRSKCCQYSAYKECPFKKCQNHGSGKNLFFKLICNIFWILILVMLCFAIYNQSLVFFLSKSIKTQLLPARIRANIDPTGENKDTAPKIMSDTWKRIAKSHVTFAMLFEMGRKPRRKYLVIFISDFNWFIKDIWMMYTLINCFKNVVFWTFPISHFYHVTTICNHR